MTKRRAEREAARSVWGLFQLKHKTSVMSDISLSTCFRTHSPNKEGLNEKNYILYLYFLIKFLCSQDKKKKVQVLSRVSSA